MKVYNSLEESLQDIGFVEGRDYFNKLSLGFVHPRDFVCEEVDSFFEKIANNLNSKGWGDYSQSSLYLLGEIIENAYKWGIEKWGIENYSDQRIEAFSYIGSKGILNGTKQYRNFLNDYQINLLKSGQGVPSTSDDPDSQNAGTFDLFYHPEPIDGLFINKRDMEIYFSKLV